MLVVELEVTDVPRFAKLVLVDAAETVEVVIPDANASTVKQRLAERASVYENEMAGELRLVG